MIINTKTIAVLGALGGQGGSVVDTFLQGNAKKNNDGPTFRIRGVTRSIESPAARSLAARGVEMVAGDVKKPESLSSAFDGADTAFVVVNFWDPEIGAKEKDITNSIFDEAKKAGVKHVVFSSLANVDKLSGGEIRVPHFSLKAESWDYLRSLGFDSVTAVEPAAYYSNWFTFFKAAEADDGTLVWTWPGTKKNHAFSQFDVNTGVGPSVWAAAQDPTKFHGRTVLLEGQKISVDDVVAKISAKLGKAGRVDYVEPAKFAKLFDGAQELANMVRWFEDYGYYGPETEDRKHGSGKEVDGGLVSFQEWLDSDEYKKFL